MGILYSNQYRVCPEIGYPKIQWFIIIFSMKLAILGYFTMFKRAFTIWTCNNGNSLKQHSKSFVTRVTNIFCMIWRWKYTNPRGWKHHFSIFHSDFPGPTCLLFLGADEVAQKSAECCRLLALDCLKRTAKWNIVKLPWSAMCIRKKKLCACNWQESSQPMASIALQTHIYCNSTAGTQLWA